NIAAIDGARTPLPPGCRRSSCRPRTMPFRRGLVLRRPRGHPPDTQPSRAPATRSSASQLHPEPMSDNSRNLKSIGLKATYPRLKILDLFQSSEQRHLTAEDVYRTLMNEGMDIGLATVYRVLTQFEQAGLLERHYFESGKAVFELNEGGHHDHLVCMQCGKVEEFF